MLQAARSSFWEFLLLWSSFPFPNCPQTPWPSRPNPPTFAVTHGAALGGRDPDRTLLNSAYQPFVLFVVELMGNMWVMR